MKKNHTHIHILYTLIRNEKKKGQKFFVWDVTTFKKKRIYIFLI